MKSNIKIKGVTDAAIGASLCALLMIISIYVPVISILSAFLSGIPIMYVTYKWGFNYGLMAIISSVFITFVLTANILTPTLLILAYVLPAAVFGFTVNKGLKFYTSLAIVLVFVLIGTIAELMIINGNGDGIKTLLETFAEDARGRFSELISQDISLNNLNLTDLINDAIELTVARISIYLPSIAIITSAITAYIIIMTGIFFLNRIGLKKINYVKFNMIKAPGHTLTAFIIVFIIFSGFDFRSPFAYIFMNMLILIAAIITISGFSFADYMLSKKIKSGYIRALIYAGIFIATFVVATLTIEILFVLGMFDLLSKKRSPQILGDDKGEKE